jgi:carbamoyltransferase
MLVLGINGGLDLIHQNLFELPYEGLSHDSAAALIDNGNIIGGIEEERLTRLKHTNRFPIQAVDHCLKAGGIAIQDVDLVATYLNEDWLNAVLFHRFVRLDDNFADISAAEKIVDIRTLAANRISTHFNVDVSAKLRFIDHHIAHAQSAYAFSGFDECLIGVVDAMGETTSGLVCRATQGALEKLQEIPVDKSLGNFYLDIIRYIGFRLHDEYKVMGLAPYGDPARFRPVFETLCTLQDDGEYSLAPWQVRFLLLKNCCLPRKKDQEIEQHHKDIAASLQETLEGVVTHVLAHFQEKTRLRRLCLAGGVAHNCTMNGKILRSGLFDSVFVQPAAHDAGAAIGAAMQAYLDAGGKFKPRRLGPLYWGSDASREDIPALLSKWKDFLSAEKVQSIECHAAKLLADGYVIGWTQGRSEFGPRALGNRSILADPRPPGNKERINAMVKKREGFRPFAPSVLLESARSFFDIPQGIEELPYMIFVVDVKADKRKLLGAVTHVDGSARIQTVSRQDNPRYWSLIKEFERLTGLPVVLNTSFNNNMEPIVESVEDAIVCFLTTGLDYLVVNDYVIRKTETYDCLLLSMVVTVPIYLTLHTSVGTTKHVSHKIAFTNNSKRETAVSKEAFELLTRADGKRTVAECLRLARIQPTDSVLREMRELWTNRVIRLEPAKEHLCSRRSRRKHAT